MNVTRRRFLSGSGIVAAGVASLPEIVRSEDLPEVKPGQRPNKIIHLVADGMSLGVLSMADQLSHLSRKRGLSWLSLHRRSSVRHGLMDMASLNSMVTDSSAASSSWGSGSRIVNGTVNILPDGRELTPLYELFGQAGWKRGLVTTTEITHATPAGFATKGLKREAAESIATQYLDRGVEVLLGGGRKYFEKDKRKDKRDVLANYKAKGYALLKDSDDLAVAPNDKSWLGTFAAGHLPFTLDHAYDEKLAKNVPTLALMADCALEKLSLHERFILQVEGGRVDHGCHSNDIAGALFDQIAFDEAIDVCLSFQKKNPDTMIVITTDHSTGNPGLNGAGLRYGNSPFLFSNLLQVRASFEVMLKGMGISWDPLAPAKPVEDFKKVAAIIKTGTGYVVSESRAKQFVTFLKNKGETTYAMMNSVTGQFGQLMANYCGVGWTGGAHTSDYVPITAIGPGSERFAGFIKNTDVFRHYTDLAKIDFRNPEAPATACNIPSDDAAAAHWVS